MSQSWETWRDVHESAPEEWGQVAVEVGGGAAVAATVEPPIDLTGERARDWALYTAYQAVD